MNAKKAARDAAGHPSTDEPARRAHDDSSTDEEYNPGDRGVPTNGPNAFLWWLHPKTPLDQDTLARKHAYYEATDYDELRKDPAPTWEDNGLVAYGGGSQ